MSDCRWSAVKKKSSLVTAATAHPVTAVTTDEIVAMVVAIIVEIVATDVGIIAATVAMVEMAAMVVVAATVVTRSQRPSKRAMPFQLHQHKKGPLRLRNRSSQRLAVSLAACSPSTYFPSTTFNLSVARMKPLPCGLV